MARRTNPRDKRNPKKPAKVNPTVTYSSKIQNANSVSKRNNPTIDLGSYYNLLNPQFKKRESQGYLDGEHSQENSQGSKAYFKGGDYDIKNRCSFSYVDENSGETKSIALLVPPNGIVWDYKLRTQTIDTYGGQVIQVLGVEIDSFKLSGFIPSGIWGINSKTTSWLNYDNGDVNNLNTTIGSTPDEINKNGLIHLGNFFRDFFSYRTQIGNFQVDNMVFEYPHYGWVGADSIKFIPNAFPSIKISNEEILPQWELDGQVVEYLSSHFVQHTTDIARSQLSKSSALKAGIGFAEFVQWSDPTATTNGSVNVSSSAKNLGKSYEAFLTNFDGKEASTLEQNGFSFPVSGAGSAAISKNVDKIISDRFTPHV
jgi:hypothetical protein